ncbi:MAG: hypothetical protein DMG91_18055 [Acidobacteria bacterium]|nr:MAG: hypothetical protein DMG91_18055 [Acidobacteriota bacterium]
MSIKEKLRGLCRVLLAAQNYAATSRVVPRLRQAQQELLEQLASNASGESITIEHGDTGVDSRL